MAFGFNANAVQQSEPGIAQRCVLRRDDVLSELDASTTASEERWAIIEIVLGADVTAIGERDVIKESAAIGFLGGFELVGC